MKSSTPKKTSVSKVPKLRFPWFIKEWEEKKLKDIGENIIGLTYSPINVTLENSGVIVLRSSNIKNGAIDLVDLVRVTSDIPEKLKLRENDILICTRNGSQRLIGKNILLKNLPEGMTFGAFMSVYRSTYNIFLSQLFRTDRWNFQVQSNLGARINQITTGYLNKFKFYLPIQHEEQQKIASFLGSVDEWIENLKQQKKSLELYKKGMMQKIFSQQIWFKDENGKDFPEWRLINLGDCLKEKSEKTKQNNEYSVLSSTMKGLFLQSDYFNKEIASSDTTGYKVLRKKQLVFSPQNLWLGNINLNRDFEIGIVSPSYKIFDIDTGIILINYLNNILKSKRMLYEYELCSEQGASIVRRNLNLDLFNLVPIKIPSLPEQQKIADFLSSIDNLLESKQQQITNAEQWKRGVMQGVFV